jgi:hypothetical protein
MRHIIVLLAGLAILGVGCKKPVPVAPQPIEVKVQVQQPKADPPKEPEEPDPEPYVGNVEDRQMQTPDWVSTIAVAQPRLTILNNDRYTIDLSQEVVEKIEGAFLATGRFQVAERSRLDSVKHEITTNNDADWFNPAYASRVGRFMGAQFLILPTVSANVGPMQTTFELQVKVLDTETGTQVHNYTIRTASSNVNINSSIRTCIGSIQGKLEASIGADFPARGVVVKVTKDKVWIDARQSAKIKPGMAMRLLSVESVYNPIAKTKGNFFSPVGQARVISVESSGVICRIKKTYSPIEIGMLAEVQQ